MKPSPALLLFFLAPAVAELLSGSAPPAEFFNPLGFLLLASLYGSGAILVRELKVRWRKGHVALFVLGAAYGILEEGLMVKSFFDPGWMDLGILGFYGRWQGVNWVWAEWLTLYHAIFSIAIPITLVELVYPENRTARWVGKKTFMGLAGLLVAVTVFGFLFLTGYRPPLLQYAFSALAVAFLIILAWRIPAIAGRSGTLRVLMPRNLVFIGFLTTLALFLLFGAGPHLVRHPLVLMILGIGFVFTIFGFLKRYCWNENTLYHKFMLVTGAVVFWIALTPFQELDKSRPDNPHGMVLVGIVALILLILLGRRLKIQAVARVSSGGHGKMKEVYDCCNYCNPILPKGYPQVLISLQNHLSG